MSAEDLIAQMKLVSYSGLTFANLIVISSDNFDSFQASHLRMIAPSVSKCTWMYTYALSITAILQNTGLELMRLFRNMSLLCLPIKIVWQCEIR